MKCFCCQMDNSNTQRRPRDNGFNEEMGRDERCYKEVTRKGERKLSSY